METIILYVDDAAHAAAQLAKLAPAVSPSGQRHWLLVGCAPRMTYHVSKWVTHSARENWRARWFARVRGELEPVLRRSGGTVTGVLARGPLIDLTHKLELEHGPAQVIDARRPKIGVELEPVRAAPAPKKSGGAGPGLVASMGALFVLACD